MCVNHHQYCVQYMCDNCLPQWGETTATALGYPKEISTGSGFHHNMVRLEEPGLIYPDSDILYPNQDRSIRTNQKPDLMLT